jgi:signal transduction histidine kinase
MRTLLLELRPAALVDTEMTDLLHQLAESITGRARVPVSVEAEHTCPLPPRVKVALYRIAQEALNNIAKHAVAGQATIGLSCTDDEVILSIRDNGRGFDPNDTSPENLGLGIMYERAAAIGTTLKIESEPGKGTQLTVIWPIAEERSLHE